MYVGGTDDLMGFILMFPFLSAEDKEKQRALIIQKATSRYFPVYEKVWRRIIFFPDSGGMAMGTLGVFTTTRSRSVSAVLYTRTSILSVGWRGIRAVSDTLGWVSPRDFQCIFFPMSRWGRKWYSSFDGLLVPSQGQCHHSNLHCKSSANCLLCVLFQIHLSWVSVNTVMHSYHCRLLAVLESWCFCNWSFER